MFEPFFHVIKIESEGFRKQVAEEAPRTNADYNHYLVLMFMQNAQGQPCIVRWVDEMGYPIPSMWVTEPGSEVDEEFVKCLGREVKWDEDMFFKDEFVTPDGGLAGGFVLDPLM